MNDLHLDESNDIHADGGRIVRTTTLAQSVGQAALCAMRTEEGEAFADPEEGVPWFGQILGLPATHLDMRSASSATGWKESAASARWTPWKSGCLRTESLE